MLLDPEIPILLREVIKVLFRSLLPLLLSVTPALSQMAEPSGRGLPRYELLTETQTKGVVEEANLLPLGTRKGFTDLITKNGDDKRHG